MGSSDRPSSLLTPNQRKVLKGEADITDRGRRAAIARIKERLAAGVVDFSLLLEHTDVLPPDETLGEGSEETLQGIVNTILYLSPAMDFDRLAEIDDGLPQEGDLDREDTETVRGIVDTIAYLYLVIEEAGLDFERVLSPPGAGFGDIPEGAIDKATRQRGRHVEEVTVKTVLDDEIKIRQRVRDGDPDLDRSDVTDALQRGIITQDEFWSWNDQQDHRPPRRGRGGPTDVLDDDTEE